MKYLVFILVTSFFCWKKSFAQKDTSFPLAITIKVEKEYDLKFPKEQFSYQISRGIYNIQTDSVKQKQFDIQITLKNNSSQPIFIWLMSCSWEDNFHINNNYIYIKGHGCDKNVPQLIKFNPGDSKIYNTTLIKSIKFDNPCQNCIYGPQVETTKLGLIIIDDIFKPKLDAFLEYGLAMEDESIWKIFWSNPLYLLTKDESSPRPVEIPIYRNNGHN